MDRVGLLKRILAGIGTLALTVGITAAVLAFWAIALSIQTSRYAGSLAPDYIPTRSETMELVAGSLGLAGAAAVAFFFVLIARVRARGRALQIICNAAICVLMTQIVVLALFGGGEWYLSRHPQSSSINFTLSSRAWTNRSWGPCNSAGLRDKEFQYAGKDVILVIGDSLAAGHGVEREERFSSFLAQSFPDRDVWTAAKPGWDTRDELSLLKEMGDSGQLDHVSTVILQYYPNDIERAANVPSPAITPPPYWSQRSYVGDFIYWRWYALEWKEQWSQYTDGLLAAYESNESWKNHEYDLTLFLARCRRRNIRLVVVVFPMIRLQDRSRPATTKVAQFFESKGIEVINLSDRLPKGVPISELAANSTDDHPSAKFHQYVAELISATLRRPADAPK